MEYFFHDNPRKIGITNRSVSGVVPDIGAYESSLERDFMELIRFDSAVKELTPQPVTIGYFDEYGNSKKYTPDGLLIYQNHIDLSPILFEIKYRSDFRNSWKTLLPKFRVAKKVAQEHGWIFKIFTENEIRNYYLDNVKFLWPYKDQIIDDAMVNHVLTIMSDLQEADPALLSYSLSSNSKNRAMMIPVIWYLISNLRIGCDLSLPLSMNSTIWTKEKI